MTSSHTQTVSLLLVEDDQSLAGFLEEELAASGYEIEVAGTLEQAIRRLEKNIPDLILSDLRLPDGTGDTLLNEVRETALPPPVVLMTAFGQVDDAVSALRKGAADFLTKPFDMDHLLLRLERITEIQRLRALLQGKGQPAEGSGLADLGLGISPAWRQVEKQLQRIAATDDPVLVTGPTGSGKEVIAQSLHQLSRRSQGPFIPVNCSGLSEHLLESELFGHTSGAFTGASRSRKGLFAAAEGGTLLLDEIGDMPLEMQTKLLRTLQENTVRPLGSDRERAVNVRIIAATHQDIVGLIAQGRFREDLYYRLETFHLELPPLRKRPEDIDLLTQHFLTESASELGLHVDSVSDAAMEALHGYAFPGNVRELRNMIRRAVAFSDGSILQVQDLPEKVRTSSKESGEAFAVALNLSLEELRRSYAERVLAECNHNKLRAAEVLGISRHTLYALLKSKS